MEVGVYVVLNKKVEVVQLKELVVDAKKCQAARLTKLIVSLKLVVVCIISVFFR